MTSLSAEMGIGGSLRTAHRYYQRLLQEHLAERNLTVAQYLHLRVLREKNTLFQNEISAELGINKASSTAIVEMLDREGLIERVRDGEDRRRIRVSLTPRGIALADTILPFAKQIAFAATHGISPADLGQFFATMDKILENLSTALARAD